MQDYITPSSKRAVMVEHTFGATPDVEERVRHRLGQQPTGFRVVGQSAAGSVYRPAVSTVNTKNHLHLKSSVAGLTVTLEVF